MVTAAAPHGRDRAKNLLWAAGRLADWAIGLGLEPVPEVLLHPSVTGRFTAHAPGLTGVTRRTLRTNLRFLARAVVPQLYPADAPLPRERAKAPYAPAEIDGYLALADAQPTPARRMRAAGLVGLGPPAVSHQPAQRGPMTHCRLPPEHPLVPHAARVGSGRIWLPAARTFARTSTGTAAWRRLPAQPRRAQPTAVIGYVA